VRLAAQVLAVAVAVLAGCGGGAPPRPAPAASQVSSGLARGAPGVTEATVSQDVVEAFGRGDFARAASHLDERARPANGAAEASLRDAWEAITRDVGQYRGIERLGTTTGLGFVLVTVRCKTDAAAFEVRLVFHGPRRPPAAPAASSVTISYAWDPPAYADATRFHDDGTVIGAGKDALPGNLVVPVGPGPFPAVVLVPSPALDRDGTVGGVKMYRDVAWGLASAGIVSIRYDARARNGAAGAPAARGQGGQGQAEARDPALDAAAAVAVVRKLATVDKGRVFLAGHGEAARVALAAAGAIEDKKLAGLALLGPAPLKARSLDAKALRRTQVPIFAARGDRDATLSTADWRAWKRALLWRPKTTTASMVGYNHFFVPVSAGTADASADDCRKPANVGHDLVDVLARVVGAGATPAAGQAAAKPTASSQGARR